MSKDLCFTQIIGLKLKYTSASEVNTSLKRRLKMCQVTFGLCNLPMNAMNDNHSKPFNSNAIENGYKSPLNELWKRMGHFRRQHKLKVIVMRFLCTIPLSRTIWSSLVSVTKPGRCLLKSTMSWTVRMVISVMCRNSWCWCSDSEPTLDWKREFKGMITIGQ